MRCPKGCVAVLALAGCAGVLGPPRGRPEDAAGLAAWQPAVNGRAADAAAAFDARLAAAPDDLLARFGRATLAYDHGEIAGALDDYAAVVTAAARLLEKDRAARSSDAAWAALLAPVAAGRARALDMEVGARRAARAEAALLAPGAATTLPWQARLELARLAEHVARRRGDAELLEREARARGCAREVFEADALGPLPHLDLDGDRAMPPAGEWSPLVATGCRLSLSARTGRPGAERLRAAVEVPAGTYDLVLDYDGEARVAVDGGPAARHGSALTAGPRVSAWTLALPAGRHELEIRLATLSGRAEIGLLVSPRAGGAAVRFVDPRAGGRAAQAATLGPGLASRDVLPALPDAGAAAAVRDLCLGQLADWRGDVEESLALGARLTQRRGFSSGLELAATIARGDPTRPASFTRDAGRAALRAAIAADDRNAQAWEDLAGVELEDDHLREAIEAARAAVRAAPRWWLPEHVLSHALRARGLEWDADRALERAAEKSGATGKPADGPCTMLDALRRRADERRELEARARLEGAVAACDAESMVRVERLRARGEMGAAAQALRTALRLAPDREDLSGDLVEVLLASGARAEALAELSLLVSRQPRDPLLRVRLADAQAAAGQRAAALETVRRAVALRPDVMEVRRAARALGLPLPLDAHRLDGTQVIRAFEASGRRYAAPAVVVLDRSVARVMPDGAQLTLTHEIVRVQSKDAIDRWAEVDVPAGAEVLTLRTHKPDGTTREPEEIAGKETVSAANVAIGDYIEWETLETKPASGAFSLGSSPGFLGDRFYFQSFDAPLDRSQFVLVTPAAMKLAFDRRAGAPAPRETAGDDGLRVTTFEATNVPQLFAERAAVPAIEYMPSIRASSGVTFRAWTRYVEEQLYGTSRSSPALRERAAALAQAAGGAKGDKARLAAAVVKWVTENVDAVDDLRDPATMTLARGRGNRLALMLALLRELDVPARPVLARSRLVAETTAPAPVEELDDFSDSILEISLGADRRVWVDPRLRYAAFGYLPPSLDGARTLALADGAFAVARSTGTADHRSVDVTIRLDEQGGGVAVATEELTGWPALEWAELVERFGADRARLRQDFEQRWLGVQFPGARLRELDVDVARSAPPTPRTGGEPPRAGVARVRYSFVSPQLAVRSDHEMRLLPTFFRSQPGRRFATEPRRSTTLVLGFDVPFHLRATVELPRSANLVEPNEAAAGRVERKGAYRFVEERRLRAGSPGGAPGGDVLVLTREANLPLTRVPPTEYAGVAADLRRVDGLEQQEIRIRLRGPRGVK